VFATQTFGWETLRLDVLVNLLLAAALGAAIGFEREVTGKSAGLRTHILICIGSTLFTEVSIAVAALGNGSGDPSRIAAQIVTGIGFLGAGAILRTEGEIRGLTTAATIWVVAAIGIAIGAGEYVTAVGTTALVLVTLWPLRWWERQVARRRAERDTGTLQLPRP
jgi:putative Mg2+ transporter-C (MgtC) family protein